MRKFDDDGEWFKYCPKCKIIYSHPNLMFGNSSYTQDVLYHYCKDCANGVSKVWRENNSEKYKEMIDRWRADETNIEKQREKVKERYSNNREYILKKNKEWGKNNLEKKREHNKRYRENHKEEIKERRKIYDRKYLDSPKGKVYQQKRNARRRLNVNRVLHDFTYDEWIEKVNKTNGVCPMCKNNVGTENLTMDHIFPLSKVKNDFVYTIDDVQVLCSSCNSKKGDRILV